MTQHTTFGARIMQEAYDKLHMAVNDIAKPMPNCPTCGEFEPVHTSHLDYGSHFCRQCRDWFTPKHTETPWEALEDQSRAYDNAKRADAALDSINPAHLTEPTTYKTLDADFLKLMDEIGLYGLDKYKDSSFQAQRSRGQLDRTDRTQSEAIADHASDHFEEYLAGTIHDHFGTRKHQLAAVAFNAMMEYVFFICECRKEAA